MSLRQLGLFDRLTRSIAAKLGRPRVAMVLVSCAECGRRHERYPSQVEKNKHGRFFCSETCLRKMGTRPRTGTDRSCQRCGDKFYASPGSPQRFCSKECADSFSGRHSEGRTCAQCGSAYKVKPSQRWRRAAKYCSKRCQGDAVIKRPLEQTHNGRCARLNAGGYVMVYEPDDDRSDNGGWYFEHRVIVERHLGRRLRSDEVVHHLNGIKSDNRLENLTVMDAIDHAVLSSGDYKREVEERLRRLDEYERRFGPLEEYEQPVSKES